MKVGELLSTAAQWTKGAPSRDKRGKALCEMYHKGAVKWCLSRAIKHCYVPDTAECAVVREAVCNYLHKENETYYIVGWNDAPERTFADIKALVEALDI